MQEPTLVERLRQMFGVELEELAGASISGEIPLSDELLSRLIAQRLAASPGAITAAPRSHAPQRDPRPVRAANSLRSH